MEKLNKKLQILADLDKEAEAIDKKLTEIRIVLIDLFWDAAEIKIKKLISI